MSTDNVLQNTGATAAFESKARILRAELKAWEKAFASSNGGRKAEREDIKRDPTIAQKYRDYNKLRDKDARCESTLQASSTPSGRPKKKRRTAEAADNKSGEKTKHSSVHPSDIDPYDAPVQLTPVAVRTFVGPTPQKNGQVLGLFDLLSPSSTKSTPSRKSSSIRSVKSIQATPSKARYNSAASHLELTPSKVLLDPNATPKRTRTNNFLTPSARRFDKQQTPLSQGKRLDETPDFLRRGNRCFAPNQAQKDEERDASTWSPIAVRMPPRPAGTGLSALVKGLKNMEEERLDEEMDLLRDLEQDAMGPPPSAKRPRLEVEDSQLPTPTDLPLGADGEEEFSDSEPGSENLGRDGKPLKVWKKRGQKRTTRKVNIKPASTKWKPEPAWEPHRDATGNGIGSANDDNPFGQHDTSSKGSLEPTTQSNVSKLDKNQPRKPDKLRKVNPAAHANYRALKIKSKGTKFRGRGRFGRR